MLDGAFLSTWQCQISFSVIKILFYISSVPFFFFTLGPLGKLFTHTEATGYTRDGEIVPIDTNGLSSYLQWLKSNVLGSEEFAAELENNFSPKDNEGEPMEHPSPAPPREAQHALLASIWRT